MDLEGLMLHMKLLYVNLNFINVCILNLFLHDVFWSVLLSERSDDCLRRVFIHLHVAIVSIHSRFYEYVHE